ncbi:MAG: Kae1-associated serine/threonine protein kinase [Nanohaloarchaea archaeon]|nr:Kae1-associated serine/threonine protein kinase [Candidatus Nanohaloarchaea archaeon]
MSERKGAEATVKIGEKVSKKREKKKYRHPELDDRIRKDRTETEARLIEEARNHNVSVPEVEKTGNFELDMEKVDGVILKEKASENKLFKDLGKNVGLLHSTGIIHGDLTTSNVIVKDNSTTIIDFGLSFRSERTEDKAVDIHLLKQVLNSSHPEVAEEAWQSFLKGYSSYEDSEEVQNWLKKVEKRGRYK